MTFENLRPLLFGASKNDGGGEGSEALSSKAQRLRITFEASKTSGFASQNEPSASNSPRLRIKSIGKRPGSRDPDPDPGAPKKEPPGGICGNIANFMLYTGSVESSFS